MSRAQGGHPAPEDLDLLLEDEAGARTSDADLAAHVDGCAQCRELLTGMADVRALLRAEASRVPPPPDDLGDRIAAALALEAGRGTTEPAAPAGRPSGDVVPLRRSPVVPRWMAVAAGLVVLVGAAGVATQLLGDGGSPTAMFGASGNDSGGDAAAGAESQHTAPATVLATGTDYEAGRLRDQVSALLADAGVGTMSTQQDPVLPEGVEDGGDAAGSGEPLATQQGVDGCLQALEVAGDAPVVVDLATWQGREVAVIVLDEPSRDAVWVVDRGCRPGADGLVHYQVVPD